MKIRNKTYKYITITLEKVVEQKTDGLGVDQKTLYWLVNTKTPDGRGVGFRAENALDVWAKLMHECILV